jgi:hypothetical protein
MVYYPKALHQQPIFAGLGYSTGDFPVTERVQEQVSRCRSSRLTGSRSPTRRHAIKEFFTKN